MKDDKGQEHIVRFEKFQFGLGDTTKGFNYLLLQADR